MSRRLLPAVWAFAFFFLLMQACAQAATYAVAPFKVAGPQGYSYLGQAIPSMLSSRLFLQGQFEPVSRQDALLQDKAPASSGAASALAKKYGADYLIWGTVSVMGDQASVDVSALSPNGKEWKKASSTPMNSLINNMQDVADSVNIEVFGRRDVTRSASAAAGAGAPNSAFLMNDTGRTPGGAAYLNPSLRYQGTADEMAQVRSQMQNFECRGIEVGDINGDGRSEVLMLAPDYLYAYTWNKENRLAQIAEYRLPAAMEPVLVRILKDNGKTYIVLSGTDDEEREAQSQILVFQNGKFTPLIAHVRRYLNVVPLPPLYTPVLIGQESDKGKMVHGPITEMRIEGDRLVRGGRLAGLPSKANVFNFTWLPADKDKRGDHVALIEESERLATYDAKGNLLSTSEDIYSGNSVYIVGDRSIGALEADPTDLLLHYVPMRMIATDLDRDGRHELILNKPVTAAGKVFNNYRTYPQGEIHALLWDGMGMELLWKTRRIKGTVCDVTLADVNNDGTLDLVVGVNAYAGVSTGLKTRSALYMFPLDTTKVHAAPNYQE
ncbi:VCBS repeat-containing protein [uncultured Mailhella sp.]|uniref:FG-GAP and VCBS repeat-containing protein n=1 Tax=uncultured Mailhella sp. TaxID=1981031 RepID=UPI002632EC15|nr:VCBS repeat-containing protein [uncultured Mailhella sp.]